MLRLLSVFSILLLAIACSNDPSPSPVLRYYEVGHKSPDAVHQTPEVGTLDYSADWRDTSFVVATADTQLIRQITAQLALPVDQRQFVDGALVRGNGGYNKNGSHSFKWHFKEDDWQLTDMTIEIYDGRAYSDVDLQLNYWVDTVKRFAPWNSYIKKEIK